MVESNKNKTYISISLDADKWKPFDNSDFLLGKTLLSSIGTDGKSIIVFQDNEGISYINESDIVYVDYETLLINYTFTDGTKCGKLGE